MKRWLQCFFGIPAALAAIAGILWALGAGFHWLWNFNHWLAGIAAWAVLSAWCAYMTPDHGYDDWGGP